MSSLFCGWSSGIEAEPNRGQLVEIASDVGQSIPAESQSQPLLFECSTANTGSPEYPLVASYPVG